LRWYGWRSARWSQSLFEEPSLKIVTEQELMRCVTLSDIFAGIACGALMGVLFYVMMVLGIG
jgi:hypothetical protein